MGGLKTWSYDEEFQGYLISKNTLKRRTGGTYQFISEHEVVVANAENIWTGDVVVINIGHETGLLASFLSVDVKDLRVSACARHQAQV